MGSPKFELHILQVRREKTHTSDFRPHSSGDPNSSVVLESLKRGDEDLLQGMKSWPLVNDAITLCCYRFDESFNESCIHRYFRHPQAIQITTAFGDCLLSKIRWILTLCTARDSFYMNLWLLEPCLERFLGLL